MTHCRQSGDRARPNFCQSLPRGGAGRRLWTLSVLFGCIFFHSAAVADDAHYQNFAPGARGAMLGGAFTAIADDSSGLYFNPAGIVDVRRANLSISTSLYGFERQLTFAKDIDVGRWYSEFTANPVTGSEVNIIPASTGVAVAFGDQLPDGSFPHGVAAGLVVPSYRGSLQQIENRHGKLDITGFSRLSDRTMVFSGGYAYRVGPWLRLGGALHTNVRLIDAVEEYSVLDTSSAQDDPVYMSTSSNLSMTNASLAATFGVKVRPARRWLLGLAVTTPSVSSFQRGTFGYRTATANFDFAGGASEPTALVTRNDRVRWTGAVTPVWGRIGAAYVRKADYTISMDLSLYAPTRYELVTDECQVDYVSEFTPLCEVLQFDRATQDPLPKSVRRQSPIPVEVERNFTANANIGIEKLMRSDLSIGAGFFTDFSSAPDYGLDEGGYLKDSSTRVSNVDHFGATISIGYFGDHSLSRLGILGVYGTGQKARPTSPGSRFIDTANMTFQPVDTQEFLVYVFWSSTFRYGEGRFGIGQSEHDT